jgi:putative DNA primase/helicase
MNKLIEELAPLPRWVCWIGKPVETRAGKKITKIPYYFNGRGELRQAATNKPETWGTYEQADKWEGRLNNPHKGIGFVLGLEQPFMCIDLDHCINKADKTFTDDEAGEAARRVLDIVKKNGEETYIEVSPSGEGLHIWGRAMLPAEKGKGVRGKYIEMYRAGRYMTVTRRPYTDNPSPVSTIQKSVDEIIKEFHLIKDSPAERRGKRAVTPSPVLNLSDAEIITKIRNSKSGPKFHSLYDLGDMSTYGDDQSRADQALLSILAFWTGKNAEQMKRIFLSSKLAEALGRKMYHEEDYLNRSIRAALETVTEGYNPKAYAAKKRAEELGADFSDEVLDPEDMKPEEKHKKKIPFLERLRNFKRNDSENADRLAALCAGKFLYCTELKTWLKYDGRKWNSVDSVELQEPARRAVKKELADLAEAYYKFTRGGGELDNSSVKEYNSIIAYPNGPAQNNMAIQNSIKLARSKPSMKCKANDFDNAPFLLNCANGVLNLKTFEFMPHSPEQRFMKCTRAAYSEKEHSSLWRDTVRQIVPDKDTYNYVQRMAGYCLTGAANEEKVFFLFGPGGTGKGTFIETLGYALGDYSTSVPVDVLLSNKVGREGNNPTPYTAGLKGSRLALSSESGIGNYFDEATLKFLTGRDAITARYLHSNPITFEPSHKLVISSNYMPAIHDVTDEGVKRRLVIIPFNAEIKDRDTTLKDRLFTPENLSDCLLWAVEGCRKWQAAGLQEGTYSQEIKKALNGYYLEHDILGEFIETKCILGKNCYVSSRDLYSAYRNFLLEIGEDGEMSQSMFTRAIKKKTGLNIEQVRDRKERGFNGIALAYILA